MTDWLKNGYPNEEDMDKLLDLVLNGTPIPKGHKIVRVVNKSYGFGAAPRTEYRESR